MYSDCRGVVNGCFAGRSWGNSQHRYYARMWGPLHSMLDEDPARVRWMPAHCSAAQSVQAAAARAARSLSDGSALERWMVVANDNADHHAKAEARAVQPPCVDFHLVRSEADRVTAVAQWVARATVAANHWPAPIQEGSRRIYLRDSDALRAATRPKAAQKRRQLSPCAAEAACPPEPPGPAPSVQAMRSVPRAEALPSTAGQRAAKKARLARADTQAQFDAADLRLGDWLEERLPGRAPPVSAAGRLTAVRARLAARSTADASLASCREVPIEPVHPLAP